ncbi:PA14 domain-containing protein [Deinococcus misasensis]|uniref:PA14 domain-containing protein n=1 Tax=Deinococcus misasensis TaxID=392413 RepID=UPI0014704767|nr:PA14 domain-containing protein [Deinococcus misasensis]
MHHWKHKILLLGALGLSACGMFQTPSKSTSPNTETTPNINFEAQGTPIVCSNQSAGGNFPYNSNGPLWRQQFFLNDNGTPLNYSTFSTDLPAVGNISMNPYVFNASGSTIKPQPWMYQYIYAPNTILSGTQSTGAVANNVVTSVSGIYGLLYNDSLKQFEIRIFSATGNKFKLYNAAGDVLPTEYGATQTYYPTINNNRVQIPTGQKVTLEFYLDPKVQYRKELIWASYKDASGVSKTDWVTVNMPYQEGILKVNAATYTVQEPTGIKTYQSAVNPLPKFKFVMRGYNNLVSADRPFLSRQGIYYTWPSSVPSGDWAAWNQFMDERKDYVLNWNLYDQKVGSASVDASGDPVLNAATVSTAAQWNLGTPAYANDKNCISKTFAPEYGSQQRFSVIQPAATVYSGATFTETQQGLKAEYFDNPDFTGKRVERLNSQINFNWGGYSPAPFISPETYSIRWSGSITPPTSGRYTLWITSGSPVRLVINGIKLLDVAQAAQPVSGEMFLRAGESYSLQMDFKHQTGDAQMKLEWQNPQMTRQVVPSSVMSPIVKKLVQKQTVTLNNNFTVAVKEDGTVWGWGSNIYNQIGNGVRTDYGPYFELGQILGLNEIKEVATNEFTSYTNSHQLALDVNGEVWSWGKNNDDGQLGYLPKGNNFNTKMDQLRFSQFAIPKKVAGLQKIKKIRVNWDRSIAISEDGKIYQWGNVYRTGYGSYLVSEIPETVKISAGGGDFGDAIDMLAVAKLAHVILKNDGTVWSYTDSTTSLVRGYPGGANHQLGQIIGLNGIVAIEGYGNVMYALDGSGQLWNWGASHLNANTNITPIKVNVLNDQKIVQVAVGSNLTLVRTEEGEVWAWGKASELGQANLQSADQFYPPVKIALPNGRKAVGIDAGVSGRFITDDMGDTWGWGVNNNCQILYFSSCNFINTITVPTKYPINGVMSP